MGGFGARDADLHADGRAGAACRRQAPTSIRRDYPLRSTEKVIHTACAQQWTDLRATIQMALSIDADGIRSAIFEQYGELMTCQRCILLHTNRFEQSNGALVVGAWWKTG